MSLLIERSANSALWSTQMPVTAGPVALTELHNILIRLQQNDYVGKTKLSTQDRCTASNSQSMSPRFDESASRNTDSLPKPPPRTYKDMKATGEGVMKPAPKSYNGDSMSTSLKIPDKLKTEKDLERISKTLEALYNSFWYHEDMTRQEAKSFLKDSEVGTFLVRNSSDPHYLFALSVKTKRGATSVRVEYIRGKFRLDCEDALLNQMPRFNCVVKLIEFYIRLSENDNRHHCVWLESTGRRDVPVKLVKPAFSAVPSLQHLCRLTINRSMNRPKLEDGFVDCLPLPTRLKAFLGEYPHKH
ncbi:suppressor of cytokine signaling 2 [Lingula anatina]|uniref:Suppressor of cytokine signaling 2 n=1 Tax=Lingula anatina TaxID=7574 RepID=A0A1S3HEH4_LINAN|nr:suppressor of cytokine signaling 2 [Lingula anatina]|eukprot:XP_013384410.1 suppressor of cytokine signaling 2 [Lingula anatina]